MIAIPSLGLGRRALFAVVLALLLPDAVRAITPEQENPWSLTQRQGVDEARVTDQKFSSAFEILYGAPRWLINLLRGSTSGSLARARANRFVFDRSGDRVEPIVTYAGPLREVLDIRDFNSAWFYPGERNLSALVPNAPIANKEFDGVAGAGAWSLDENWAPDGVPTSTDDVIFNNAFLNPLPNVHLDGGSYIANAISIDLTTNQTWGLGANTNAGGGIVNLTATLTLTSGDIKRSNTANSSVTNIGASTGTGSLVGVITLVTTGPGYMIANQDTDGILQIDAIISGPTRTVTKNGVGTVVFGGANTYTGATTVNAGTLLINGDESAATGAVSVKNAGTLLGGSGIIGGAVTVDHGASITAGTNGVVGALTLNSGLTFSATSATTGTYKVDISGATSDLLAIAGVLDLSGSFDQLTLNSSPNGTHNYVLATYGSVIGQFDLTNIPSNYELVYGSNTLSLVLVPVPESSTWIGAALALAAIAFTQRKKFRGLIPPRGDGSRPANPYSQTSIYTSPD